MGTSNCNEDHSILRSIFGSLNLKPEAVNLGKCPMNPRLRGSSFKAQGMDYSK